MMERRDRSRRLTASVPEAAAAAGAYTVMPAEGAARNLGAFLRHVEERAADVIEQMLAGAFPPKGGDRATLALFVAVQLLLGATPRAAFAQAVTLLTKLVVSKIPEGEDEPDDPPGPAPIPEPRRADVVVYDDEPRGVSLAAAPHLAGLLADRPWQLVRFPRPVLLTGDTPAVPWSPSGSAAPSPTRLSVAAEVRVPLDPRHALILARSVQLGEVVRDLDDRHAGALNRTVADAARKWMYHHPACDPLAGVELLPA